MGFFTPRIISHARDNGGVVTRSEALALGIPSTSLERIIGQGILRRIGHGVYALAGVDIQNFVVLSAACRKLGAVVSHQSAAELHGLDRPYGRSPTVSVPRRRTKEYPGVVVHQLTDLTDDHITTIRGLPITRRERTVMDLAAVLRADHLESIVDRGLAAGSLRMARLTKVFEKVGRQGKPGTAKMRSLLERRGSAYTAPESELERLLVKLIDDYGLPTPVRQYSPDWLAPSKGRVDLAYPDRKLVVEADGRRWHTMFNSFEVDRLRDNAAQLAGWRVLRFTWDEITGNAERVAETILRALKLSDQTPYSGRST